MKKKNYLDKNEFLKHISESQKLGYVTNELGQDFIILVDNILASKYFIEYNKMIKEEMKGDALLKLVQIFQKYDTNRNSSPFAYFTQTVFNSFYQTYNKFKRHWKLVSKLKIDLANSLYDQLGIKVDINEETEGLDIKND